MKFSLGTIFELKQLLRELGTGLKRLDFINNFESFEIEAEIDANTELRIRNQLTFIPSRVIIDSKGNALVTRGETEWSNDYLYIQNHDLTNSSTVKLTFFK